MGTRTTVIPQRLCRTFPVDWCCFAGYWCWSFFCKGIRSLCIIEIVNKIYVSRTSQSNGVRVTSTPIFRNIRQRVLAYVLGYVSLS